MTSGSAPAPSGRSTPTEAAASNEPSPPTEAAASTEPSAPTGTSAPRRPPDGLDRVAPRRRRALTAATAVLFLAFVDVFALLPTVAPHVDGLGAGAAGVGLAVGAYSAANLPANIVGGILVDRIGRRRVTMIGLAAAAVTVAAYAVTTTVVTFILVRLLHGVAGGILVPAVFAAAGDRARTGQEGRTFGRIGAVIGAAAVVSPAMAGIVRQTLGTDAVFLIVSGVLLVGLLVAAVGLRDAPTVDAPRQTVSLRDAPADDAPRRTVSLPDAPTVDAPPPTPGAMRALLQVGVVRRALVGTAVLTAAVGVLAGFLPLTADALGAPASAVGGLFTAYALVAAGVMLSPLSARIDRSGPEGPLAVGLAILAASLLVLTAAPSLAVATVGSALFGAGYGLVFPAVTAATSASATATTRGRAFGLFNVAFSVGLAVGPPVIGGLAQLVPVIDPFVPAAVLCAGASVAIAHRRHA